MKHFFITELPDTDKITAENLCDSIKIHNGRISGFSLSGFVRFTDSAFIKDKKNEKRLFLVDIFGEKKKMF